MIDWLIDNAVWLMLAANVFSLVVGYAFGSTRGRQSGEQHADQNVPLRVSDPNNRPSDPA